MNIFDFLDHKFTVPHICFQKGFRKVSKADQNNTASGSGEGGLDCSPFELVQRFM